MTDNNENEQQEPSNLKPKKLKGTSGLHLGNEYSNKLPPSPPPVRIYCPKCNTTFNSDIEFHIHSRQCNK